MDTKALRQKILDLAIRGKLVPQDPNDEPASVLLERIRAEKQQMVKDGKLKAKDIKNDTVIFKGDDNLHYEQFADGTVKCIEDEVQFELPNGWNWVRMNSVSFITKLAGFEYTSNIAPNLCDCGVPLFKGKNVQDGEIIYEFESFIPDEISDSLPRSQINRKCILTPYVGTIGNIGIHLRNGKFHLGSNVGKIELYNQNVYLSEEYTVYFLRSNYGYKELTKHIKATAQASISIEALRDVLLPVPPENEQKRIETTIREILSFIEKIEIDKKIIKSNTDKVKSKILDLAIRGKLVPQDPNDEPASVLLERIRAEKEELIKQGKIKRDKKESVIFKGDDNSYYQDLPQNWQVSTLREVTTPLTLNDGDWILSENMTDNGEVKLLQLGSIGNMSYIDKGFKYLTKDTFDELSCTEIFTGYLIINRIISDKMCCCIVPDIDGTIITTVDTCWIAPSETSYDIKFLMYQLASPSFQSAVLLKATGTTRKRISKNNLIDLHFLLPPLAEQRRIVNTIEALFAQIDKIAEQIS